MLNLFLLLGQGTIDVDELKQALIEMGQDPTDEEVVDMLDMLDFDQDGHLDIQEFLAFLRVQRREAVAQLGLKFIRKPVVVETVAEDKAAAKAGVKPGFLVAAVNGISITGLSLEQIMKTVANEKSNGAFSISFARSEETLLKWIEEAGAPEKKFIFPAFGTLGIEFQVDSRRANCVAVGVIRSGTNAASIDGLVAGMIVTSIQGRPVRGMEYTDVMDILRQEKTKAVQKDKKETMSLGFVQLEHATSLEICKFEGGSAPLGMKLKFAVPDPGLADEAVNLDAKQFDPRSIKITFHRGQTMEPKIVLGNAEGDAIVATSVSPDMQARYEGLVANSILLKVASQPVSMLPLSEVLRLIENVAQWANYVVEFRRPQISNPMSIRSGEVVLEAEAVPGEIAQSPEVVNPISLDDGDDT